MIIDFSKQTMRHHSLADTSSNLIDYMGAKEVLKHTLASATRVARDPVPELLLGHAPSFKLAGRAVEFKHKFRTGVISFSPDEVDVRKFNGGDPTERHRIDLTVRLFLDLAFAGIPALSRPPVYMTTHTHLGRLELHFATLRAIHCPDGSVRSHNPHYPHPQSSYAWSALRDFLNARFGWLDPLDPARRRDLALPDWQLKRSAEGGRASAVLEPDIRMHLHQKLMGRIQAGQIHSRAGVIEFIAAECRSRGWSLHRIDRGSITIGPEDAFPDARYRLRGLAYSEHFTSLAALRRVEDLAKLQAQRMGALQTAGLRLQEALDYRMRFNLHHFGRGLWPPIPVSVSAYQAEDAADAPRLIPHRHAALPNTARRNPNYGNAYDPYGAQTDGLPLEDRSRSGSRAGGNGLLAKIARRAERQNHDLAELAHKIAGPTGLAAIAARLVTAIMPLRTALTIRLVNERLLRGLMQPLSDLTAVAKILERNLNGSILHPGADRSADRLSSCPGAADPRHFESAVTAGAGRSSERGSSGRTRRDIESYRWIGPLDIRAAEAPPHSHGGDRWAAGAVRSVGSPDGKAGPEYEPHRISDAALGHPARRAPVNIRLVDWLQLIRSSIHHALPLADVRLRRVHSGIRVFADEAIFDVFPDSVRLLQVGKDPALARTITAALGAALEMDAVFDLSENASPSPEEEPDRF